MREYPQRRVSIEGFTDSVGNAASNQDLSERRASAVRLALLERGIDPARVIVRGFGEAYPVASNSGAIGRQTVDRHSRSRSAPSRQSRCGVTTSVAESMSFSAALSIDSAAE